MKIYMEEKSHLKIQYQVMDIINLFYKDFKTNINIHVSGFLVLDFDLYYAISDHRYYIQGRIGDRTIGLAGIIVLIIMIIRFI